MHDLLHVQVSIHLPSHASSGESLDVGLAGMFEPAREDDLDAVLIFEPDGTFRMERLAGQIKARCDHTTEV